MKPSHLSYAFLGSFLVAVFLLQWWQRASYPAALWIILGVILFTSVCCVSFQRIRTASLITAAVLLGLSSACLSVMHVTHIPDTTSVDFYTGQPVTAVGIIAEMPDIRPTSARYAVDVRTLTMSGRLIPVTGRTLVTDRRMWPQFSYGDEVRFTGILQSPQSYDGFDYGAYLGNAGIYSTLSPKDMTLVSAHHGNPLIASLTNIRSRFEMQINRVFPEPEASFLAGLLTGSRRGMPASVTQAFKQTGLTHIVAISGFNITIVITLIGSLLFFLPLKWRFLPTVAAIILFTLLVGAGASVVRAAIMGILGLLALQTGRMPHARLIILWTAFVMLLWNPAMLWSDASFQLSFLAVIGLTECALLLDMLLKRVPNTFSIRDALMMTIAAQAFAMPWVVWVFGMLSVVSPVANILVEPLIPPAMLLGFAGTTLSMITFPLGQVIAFPAYGLLHLIIWIAESLAAVPGAALHISAVSLPCLAVYYSALVIALLEYNRRMKRVHAALA